jgi:hypothetical protein
METPLHIAVRSNFTEFASLLLVNGANYTLKDSFGLLAINYTSSIEMLEIILPYNQQVPLLTELMLFSLIAFRGLSLLKDPFLTLFSTFVVGSFVVF